MTDKRPIFRLLINMHDEAEDKEAIAKDVYERQDTSESWYELQKLSFISDSLWEVLVCRSAFGEE